MSSLVASIFLCLKRKRRHLEMRVLCFLIFFIIAMFLVACAPAGKIEFTRICAVSGLIVAESLVMCIGNSGNDDAE